MQYLFGAFQFWPVIVFIPASETMSPVSFTRLAKAGSLTLQRTSGATFASVTCVQKGEIAGPFLKDSNIARLMRCYGSF